MTKKLILLMAAIFAVLGYTFADTSANSDAATADTATATSDTSNSGTENIGEDDLDLNSILNDSGDETSGAQATTAPSQAPANAAITWGYADTDLITATSEGGSIVLKSPVLKDAAGNNIMTYVVKYSTKSMSEKIDSLEGASAPQEKSFVFVASGEELIAADGSTGTTTEVSMKIDGLTSGTYYFIITPKNADNVEGAASKEISAVAAEDGTHGAAGTDVSATTSSNGVDLTTSGSTATISWSSAIVSGATQVQIFTKFAGDADYKKISDVDASKGTFTFNVQSKGDYLVKWIAIDSAGAQVGSEQILTGKPVDVAIKAPKVGPASTAVAGILLLSVVGYVTYRFRKIRS